MSFLNGGLQGLIDKIKGKKYIKESDFEEIMKDIRSSFLEADVDYSVITQFNELVKKRALGQKVFEILESKQTLIKIIKDTLVDILGSHNKELQLKDNFMNVILLMGLQGSGKTTTSGKLAFWIKQKFQKKVLIIAADIYRFGAIEQLVHIGEKIGVEVFFQKGQKILNIIDNGLQYALYNNFDVVIIDTAGMLNIDEKMIQELKQIQQKSNPSEILIVIDSLLGQKSSEVTKSFHDKINATGVILTKMDADVKGGIALSVKFLTKLPIKFISSSEKHDDIHFEVFHPERIVSRILGMGDILTLIDNVESKLKQEKENSEILEKILKDNYNYYDLQKQLKFLKKIGSIKNLLNFIPGISSKIKQMPVLEDNIIQKFEALIQSMTHEERIKPNLIDANNRRRTRIIKGSGNSNREMNFLMEFMKKQKQIQSKIKSEKNDSDINPLDNPEEFFKKWF
ncbi:signal recognition particle protein [Candidatus Phytoplasma pini]|uniref:signal-recognition-particle GTPase n=1 Tax=Candidatus Phytoplasma pini TaxID=267362 RepID=A0A559KJB6_9MOLU|nr:signal recognition particle receptor subunit alpha [Candidatus Phytoplasma pini]TVY12223.1 Signal recognition particle GTPase [Candidatus Phytoplasma pini]